MNTPPPRTEPASRSHCPRCGAGFDCGAAGPGPCACASVALSPALQQSLRARFSGCLCLACLRELARADEPGLPSAPSG